MIAADVSEPFRVRFGREAKIRWPLSSSGCRGCSILSSRIVGSVEYLGRF